MYLTYEELKQAENMPNTNKNCFCLYLTYEELKRRIDADEQRVNGCLYLTYEELKRLFAAARGGGQMTFVSYL
ncbi:hypothetical protein B4168_3563 [Anoxybacillus flavithermus]|nr:hypothetical protein B4168_3563 [Anoxybacillus flavithermus]